MGEKDLTNATDKVAENFKNVNGCSVADVSNGCVELTVTCMTNCPNMLPGGRKSADVLTNVWGYTYTVEFVDDETCIVSSE